jgi:RimJ/RimL family protein N-acetyltransferase
MVRLYDAYAAAVISTPRLMIEPLAVSHAPGLFAALDDPAVGTYIGGPDVTTVEALEARIVALTAGPGLDRHPERWHNAVVMLRSDGHIIGRVEATSYGDWAEIAYVFGPRWSGHGYATEAVRWLIDDLHRQGIDELWAAVHPDNDRSLRLLGRVGFVVVAEPERSLGSFDDGDVVLRRLIDAASPRQRATAYPPSATSN